MPRKPNYRFERAERDRLKAAKKAARLAAKQERAEAAAEGRGESGLGTARTVGGGVTPTGNRKRWRC